MAVNYPALIWHNGKIKPWAEATTQVMAHALHYGSSILEGIRSYETPKGQMIFRLHDHMTRFYNSAKVYDIKLPYTQAELEAACREVIKANKLPKSYIRPVAFRGAGGPLSLSADAPIEVAVGAWEMGAYLGKGVLEEGIDAGVSSWQRFAPNTLPTMAKSAANYMNAQLIKMEAITNGYVEGIALDTSGNVSEGSGANTFVVRQGKLFTTPLAAAILPGITRDSVITLAQEMGYTVIEQSLPREILYIADELFFCGTAAEVTPIRSVDRITIGNGKPGPITRQLQERYLSIAEGRAEDRYGWLSFCNQPVTAGR